MRSVTLVRNRTADPTTVGAVKLTTIQSQCVLVYLLSLRNKVGGCCGSRMKHVDKVL
jgi:methionine synthase I (cobalamin-dependent)